MMLANYIYIWGHLLCLRIFCCFTLFYKTILLGSFVCFQRYGFGLPGDDVLQVLRDFHSKFGLRILYTIPCYKDDTQGTKEGIRNSTAAIAKTFINEQWLAFYDLCTCLKSL